MSTDRRGDPLLRGRLASTIRALRREIRSTRQASAHLLRQLAEDAEAARRDSVRRAAVLALRGQAHTLGPVARLRMRMRQAHLPLRDLARHPAGFVRELVRFRHQAYRRAIAEFAASELFDLSHYRVANNKPAAPGLFAHFILRGDAANESPHVLFDPVWYRSQAPPLPPDVPPLTHYLRHGGWALRSPHPLFDAAFYVAQGPPGWASGPTPLTHFLLAGGVAGASPHPLFDSRAYLAARPDLVAAGLNPLLHYLRTGADELLDPHPLFSTSYYRASNPALERINPLEHFVRTGAGEGRSPHPLFDIEYYLRQRRDLQGRSLNILVHYLEYGGDERVDPHLFFDTRHYLRHADIGGANPLLHFLKHGWHQDLVPNTWFDARWYRERNGDVVGLNPLLHFAEFGCREGRAPSAGWSDPAVRERFPQVAAHLERVRRQSLPPVAVGGSFARVVPLRVKVSGTSAAGRVAPRARTIICVGHVSPWPVAAGNQYALSRLLHEFQRKGHRIILVLTPIPSEPLAPGAMEQLAREFGNVIVCDREGAVRFTLRDVPDVLSALDRSGLTEKVWMEPGPDLDFCPDSAFAVVRQLVEACGPSVILAQYIFMSRLFPVMGPECLRVIHTHDVFSQKASNVVAYGIDDSLITEAEEGRLLRRSDVIMAVTPEDGVALRRMAPGVDIVLNKVDAEVSGDSAWPSRPVALLPASGNQLNTTGLRDFIRFAWPAIRARVVDAELRVCGGVSRIVPPGLPGVTALGHVPDLGDEYARARVVINPAVAGTGLKIKTVEALAHLRPVVGWPHNRDGLAQGLLSYVDEVTDWEAFAHATAERLAQSVSPFDADAIARVTRELSPEESYGPLEARIARFFESTGNSRGR